MPTKTQTSLAAREKNARETPQDAPTYVMVVKDGEKVYKLRSDELGPADRMVCRQQTGLSLNEVLTRFDTDTPLYILWLARRKSGEPNLSFNHVISKFPNDASLGRIDFRIEDIDGNEIEVEDDPLAASA